MMQQMQMMMQMVMQVLQLFMQQNGGGGTDATRGLMKQMQQMSASFGERNNPE